MKKTVIRFTTLLSTMVAILTFTATARPEVLKLATHPVEWFHIGSSDRVVGQLKFVGGLEIESENPDFGGLSGLRFSSDGSQMFAVSDKAHWLTADLLRNEAGKLVGVSAATYSCICRRNGQPYGSKHWGDAEALEITGNRAFIAFERLNRVNGYDLRGRLDLGPPAQVTASFKPFEIDYSQGIEALALVPDGLGHAGRFVVITEESLNSAGNNRAFIADANRIDEFAITRSGDYSITDATFTPDGELLVVERRFGLSSGIGIRIRRFDWAEIGAEKTVEGQVLMEAGLASRIDNMEGITSWRDTEGQIRIAILSDDNFSSLQRTLLLEFVLNQ